MPVCYMLIGPPCSGKSTYVSKNFSNDVRVISSDKYIEDFAAKANSTYAEVFNNAIKEAQLLMNKELEETIASGEDFVWDQTNIDKKTRRGKLNNLKRNGYTVVAIAFEPAVEKHQEMILSRPHKTIPDYIMAGFMARYEPPHESEGFSSLIFVR